ncbi:hypothetical protein [Hyphomicrobium sp.]|uniref:hypothetical protein n=1 Tax=Hyphomicrobium sp. TaxID=82 RepID=UPI000F9D5C0C|nr:hypothetical protein [Hyphomicrobium sp.]RUP10757.1 MAG: hypothetical protein EKK38_04415 [Hyphomicrobium sp.]
MLKTKLLFTAAIIASGLVAADAIAQVGTQGLFGTYDLSQLPETKGVVKQFVPSPHGSVDGLILQDGTEVNFPPHLGTQVVFAIKPGDTVSIRGLRARMTPLVDAASIRNDATGATIVDTGPGPGPDLNNTVVAGNIAQLLHGKQGEVNGALLADGTIVRLPPHEVARLGDVLSVGRPLAVSGMLTATPLGKVVEAWSIGASQSSMTELDRPPAPIGPKGPKG